MNTIKDLKKIIENLPDNMLIGSSGHYGEYLECYNISINKVNKDLFNNRAANTIEILNIEIESPGPEPD